LRLLEEEAGLVPAEVKEIQRQSGTYKAAVKALAEGQAAEGFKRLDELGWVHEITQEDRYKRLAADYVEAVIDKKTALVVSPTHSEGDRITAEIRQRLKEIENNKKLKKNEKRLFQDERTFQVLENANLTQAERGDAVNYGAGDVLVFHQNAKGFARGDRVSVDKNRKLPLDQAQRFQAFHRSTLQLAPGDRVRITRNGTTVGGKHTLNNGSLYQVKDFDRDGNIVLNNGWTVDKDWGFLTHGYVVTSHASQGKTVQRVFVGQASESFPASSREQFYVSASRAKERVTVYTDDKEALLEAVSKSDERLSATELVNGTPQREVVALHQRIAEVADQRRDKDRETLNYER